MEDLDFMCEACTENDLVLRILLNEAKHRVLPRDDNEKPIFPLQDVDFELVNDLVKHTYSYREENYQKELNTLLRLYVQIKEMEHDQLSYI